MCCDRRDTLICDNWYFLHYIKTTAIMLKSTQLNKTRYLSGIYTRENEFLFLFLLPDNDTTSVTDATSEK